MKRTTDGGVPASSQKMTRAPGPYSPRCLLGKEQAQSGDLEEKYASPLSEVFTPAVRLPGRRNFKVPPKLEIKSSLRSSMM
jgi:hypothetical protein